MSRIRTNLITNRMANGAPTVSNGLVISGVTTSTNVSVASSVTATTFYGSGANLTGITQTAINNNANNRVITGSGSANTLEGEANLTFDGDNLLIKSSTDGRRISFAGDGTSHYMKYDNTLGGIILNGYGGIAFETNGTNERLRIPSGGGVGITTDKIHNASSINIAGVMRDYTNSGTDLCDAGGLFLQPITTLPSTGKSYPGIFWTGNTTSLARARAGILGVTASNNDATDIIFLAKLNAGGAQITPADERMRITNAGKVGINETAPDTKFHITHSSATEDVIKLEAKPVSAGTGERSRMIFQVTQSNGQSAKLGHIASHSLNNWGGELAFHTKPANGTPNNTTNEVMRMHANGYITQPAQPSFSAHYSVNSGWNVSNGSVMNFNTTRHNTGSHYSTSNYRFTAPVNGHYEFAFYSIYNSDLNNNSNGAVNMRVNGSTVQKGGRCHFTKDGTSWDHVSYSVIYYLNASDYVDIVNDGGQTINYHGGSWSGFTGQLLS